MSMPNQAKKIGLYLHDDDMSFPKNFLVQKSVPFRLKNIGYPAGVDVGYENIKFVEKKG